MKGRKIAFTLLFGGILLPAAAWVYLAFPPAAEAQTVTQQTVEVGQVAPNAPRLADTPAPQLSDREMEALLQRKLELREQMAVDRGVDGRRLRRRRRVASKNVARTCEQDAERESAENHPRSRDPSVNESSKPPL